MWMFTTKGFLSIVQHKDMPPHFQVKSRVPEPLRELWPDSEIEVIHWADYRYRITMPKEEVTPVLAKEIESVLYTSFKDECRDEEAYYHALTSVWTTMYRYQSFMED